MLKIKPSLKLKHKSNCKMIKFNQTQHRTKHNKVIKSFQHSSSITTSITTSLSNATSIAIKKFKSKHSHIPKANFSTSSSLSSPSSSTTNPHINLIQIPSLKLQSKSADVIRRLLLQQTQQLTTQLEQQSLITPNATTDSITNTIHLMNHFINDINDHFNSDCESSRHCNYDEIKDDCNAFVDAILYPFDLYFPYLPPIKDCGSYDQPFREFFMMQMKKILTKEERNNISTIYVNGDYANKYVWDLFTRDSFGTITWLNTISFDFTTNIPTLTPFTTKIDIVRPIRQMLYDIDELSDQLLIIRNSDIYDITPMNESIQSNQSQQDQSQQIIPSNINANILFRPYFKKHQNDDIVNNNEDENDSDGDDDDGNDDGSGDEESLANIKLKWEYKKSLSQQQKELITTLSPILSQNYKSHKEEYILCLGVNIDIDNIQSNYIINHEVDISEPLSTLINELTRQMNQSLQIQQYQTLHISSPSILNNEWIEIQGENEIINNVQHLRIGEFVTNNNQTIKFKWSNSKHNEIIKDQINRFETAIAYNNEHFKLPEGKIEFTIHNLITDTTTEYNTLNNSLSLSKLIQNEKDYSKLFISSPSILNGEWLQIKGHGAIMNNIDFFNVKTYLLGQDFKEVENTNKQNSWEGDMKFIGGQIKINNNPSDIPLPEDEHDE